MTRRFTTEQLLEMRDEAAGIAVMLQGSFKAETDRLAALNKDVQTKLDALGGYEKAVQTKAEAEEYASAKRAEVDSLWKTVQAEEIAVKRREEAVTAREIALDAAETAVEQEKRAQAAMRANLQSGMDDLDRRVTAFEAQRKSVQDTLERERTILTEQQQRLKSRAAALQEPL